MADEGAKKVLFINSGMTPYIPEDFLSRISRDLPQGIQERKREIRIFMPRFGCVNERKHQLHEVIRLSGINLIINEVDHPLVIKVASIPAGRIQVYFIDNSDFFDRKETFFDASGKFFEDNEDRAIFFARGVLETVKKLRWAPDVIHCQGWISHLIPVFLKKAYKDDPIFANSKVVLSLYDDFPAGVKFSKDFAKKILWGGIEEKDLSLLSDPDGVNLAKTAARFADGAIVASDKISPALINYCRDRGLKVLPYKAKAYADNNYIDDYNAFYDGL